MRLIIKNSFFETLSTVSDSAKLEALDFIEKIEQINDLSEVDSEPLVGFPYYHKISGVCWLIAFAKAKR